MDNRNLQPNSWVQADKIRAICAESPYITLADIAKQLGISRQRVHQVIERNNKLGINPIVRHRPLAKRYYCEGCNKQLQGKRKTNKCASCLVEDNSITAVCGTCKNEFKLVGRQASVRRANVNFGTIKHPENIFCSKKCSGAFIGNNYGFAYTRWGKKRSP